MVIFDEPRLCAHGCSPGMDLLLMALDMAGQSVRIQLTSKPYCDKISLHADADPHMWACNPRKGADPPCLKGYEGFLTSMATAFSLSLYKDPMVKQENLE